MSYSCSSVLILARAFATRLLVVAACTTASANGQEAAHPTAFRVSLGIGSARTAAICNCRSLGLVGTVQLQQSRRPWSFGGELGAWSGVEDDGLARSLVLLLATAEYAPYDTSGLRVRLGLGVSRADIGIVETGPAIQLAVAYDIARARSRLTLTPFIAYSRWLKTVEVPEAGGFKPNILSVCMGIGSR